MKKICIALVVLLLCFYVVPVGAYEFPHEFWGMQENYECAVNSGNNGDIVKYGWQIVNLMKNQPDCKEKRDVMTSRLLKIGLSYEIMSDFSGSLKAFEQLYDYADDFGGQFDDLVKTSKKRIDQYTSHIKMYTDGGTPVYYGAKNEPKAGVLFGVCSDGLTRPRIKNESMVLTYQELSMPLMSYNTGVVRQAEKDGCAVEFALNCTSGDLKSINSRTSYLKAISEMFDNYPSVPVFLRFAAEFDTWYNEISPEEFISAFRYVSSYFKDRNPNVAIVWSPTQAWTESLDINDYYPGDAYVDWVGMSSYAGKYFLGKKGQSNANQLVFKAGHNSNPVIAVKELVELYGDRKPIMLSETGCGHYAAIAGEDASDFAMERLMQYYSYLPMVYPQIKLIAYFDQMHPSDKNDYRLDENKAMQDQFVRMTSGGVYIQAEYDSGVELCYRPLYNGAYVNSVFPVSCYAHIYGESISRVTYYIDGKYAGVSSEIPFTTYIDASSYPGQHRVSAVALSSSGKTITAESTVNIGAPTSGISVSVSEKNISFDREPVIYNSRTMVPMRKIFEELGATVTWDGNTKTATGRRGDRTVKLTLDSKVMYVNSRVIKLDTPPILMSDRTLVPVRAVAEGLGCEVDWNPSNRRVSIEPIIFRWSDWMESLPSEVDEDMYYIEEKTQYKYREKEIYTNTQMSESKAKRRDNYLRTETEYGSWSGWSDNYISGDEYTEVDTRTQYEPKRYHYAHYCIGQHNDKDKQYRTRSYHWDNDCSYHDIGWFDYELPMWEDDDESYRYTVNGDKYRCSNYCWRWYLIEETGGEYTQYRSRDVYKTHYFWEWSSWSEYSDDYPRGDIDIEERTLYRYKEK